MTRYLLFSLALFLAGCSSKPATSGPDHAAPDLAGLRESSGLGSSEGAGAIKKPDWAEPWPPDSWTHKELAEHLGKKGVKVTIRPTVLLDRPERPAAWFADAEAAEVLVFLCSDPTSAQATAGTDREGSFTFGCFAICDRSGKAQGHDLIAKLKKALESR